jgi:hypothetical protein
MYILTLSDTEEEGAYAVETKDGDKVLQIFEQSDDAERYIGLLEADNFPSMSVTEIESDQAIAACDRFGYNYVIITPEDFVIPPEFQSYDFI